MFVRVAPMVALVAALGACKGDEPAAEEGAAAAEKSAKPSKVGYDLRVLRPRDEPLQDMFERMRDQALGEGKRVAVLFSADWCESCQRLDAELGNRHPESMIGDVRVMILKEEHWEGATRMNEFNELRRRWSAPLNVYPLFVLLDDTGGAQEEMKDAIARLEEDGIEPTVENWFDKSRFSG